MLSWPRNPPPSLMKPESSLPYSEQPETCHSPEPYESNSQTTLTNQNDIRDEIKSRLNSGDACYHSVQNLVSSLLI
jgi:hypothetical protein